MGHEGAVPQLSLVLFDLDGTLFDHDGAACAAVEAWLEDLAVAPTEELILAWFDAEARSIAAWHRGELGWTGQRRARLREFLALVGEPVGDAASLDRTFADYLSHYQRAWRAYPDAAPALDAVRRAGLDVAVLTNGADHQQRDKLAAVGLAQRVGPVFSSDAIGFAKPDVRAYRHVCSALDRAPATVLHVGDRYELDVVGARAAGLGAVHLDRADHGPFDESDRITTLAQLPRFIHRTRSG